MTIQSKWYIRSIELEFLCSEHMAPLIEPLFTYVVATRNLSCWYFMFIKKILQNGAKY